MLYVKVLSQTSPLNGFRYFVFLFNHSNVIQTFYLCSFHTNVFINSLHNALSIDKIYRQNVYFKFVCFSLILSLNFFFTFKKSYLKKWQGPNIEQTKRCSLSNVNFGKCFTPPLWTFLFRATIPFFTSRFMMSFKLC